ncbi:hypothetical protein [Nonomuraea gerenzanensis]|uniref:Lipoprotein n=1 Tax=Nonomuraea gerenzanensis TaxID=93944 RepID=A0A1M4EAS2_9ACTN|nr:hypothetical protein [Nonomuraea gerenzanensis]UBU17891.1 hypothetical protein LCN96_23565 [Nonomuraea gerenzanensis]SBO95683.1 hypothetical protein BN4615_P5199 [Nonomuraea gerenzanensis]
MGTPRGGRAATAVAILLATTGCSAPLGPLAAPAPPSAAVTPTPDPRKAALAEAAKSLPALLAARGPVVCTRTGEEWRVTAYDDAFRTPAASLSSTTLQPLLTEIAARAGGEKAVVRSLCGATGDPGVSPVSPDGRRIAVQVNGPNEHADQHVGWLDLGTGAFTDLTARSNKKGYVTETFSDDRPGFAPDGSLWFRRGLRYYSAAPDGTLTPRALSMACIKNESDDIYYRVVGPVAVVCPGVVHPSGKFAADPTTVAKGLMSVPGAELDLLSRTIDGHDDEPMHKPFGMEVVVRDDGRLRGCTPLAWLGTSELLCQGGGNDFYTARVAPELARDEVEYVQNVEVKVVRELAPATESSIVSVALSKDRRSLIIASAAEGELETAKLYRVGLEPASAPVEIGPVPDGSVHEFTLLNNFQHPVNAPDRG